MFFTKFTQLIAVIGCLILSSAAVATDASLTLADAQRRAVERSRLLSAHDHAVTASREMAVAAGQLPAPVAKFGVDNLPVNGADRFSLTNDFMTMRRVGLMQEMTSSDKRQLRADRFEREADKTLAEKSKSIAAIERDTALAWLELYYALSTAALIEEQAQQARQEILAADGAYRAGRGSQADVFAAKGGLAMIDDRASDSQQRIHNAKTMLARWVGESSELPLAGKPSTDTIHLNTDKLDTQLEHHPEIAVLSRQEDIARVDAKLAQANKKSDWSVEVTYQQRGSAYSNMVSIGVSIPLQWGQKNRADREVSSKLALVEQAKAERDETLRAHVAETRSMINEWENSRERHTRYEQELTPLAAQRTQAVLAAYRGGKATLTEVLAAQRNEIDVRMQALQLESNAARLWAQLNFLAPSNVHYQTESINKEAK